MASSWGSARDRQHQESPLYSTADHMQSPFFLRTQAESFSAMAGRARSPKQAGKADAGVGCWGHDVLIELGWLQHELDAGRHSFASTSAILAVFAI